MSNLPNTEAPYPAASPAGEAGDAASTSEALEAFLEKIRSTLTTFTAATGLQVNVIEATDPTKLPMELHETCRQALAHSTTATQCMRHHRHIAAATSGLRDVGLCPFGLFFRSLAVEVRQQVVAHVEVGPAPPDPRIEPACSLLKWIISQLVLEQESFVPPAAIKGPEYLRRAIQHIHRHFDQPVFLNDLAQTAGLSADRFGRVFRAHTGVSFSHYLNKVRIDWACSLLKNSPKTRISEVAMECGFDSIPYFNRQFARLTGMSPKLYRNQNRILTANFDEAAADLPG